MSHGGDEKPFSYVHLFVNLSCLQCPRFVTVVSLAVARMYANRVLLTCAPAVMESVCKMRVELQNVGPA